MTDSPADPGDAYLDGTCQWWHPSQPSPELSEALADGWLAPPGRALDLGCGLGAEIAELARRGFEGIGIDLSESAVENARTAHRDVSFVVGDVRQLPFEAETFDVLLDRGCLHYLDAAGRARYEHEAWRVLRPGGRLLLWACLFAAGARNDLSEDVISDAFRRWHRDSIKRRPIPSDTRSMDAVITRLRKSR